jgi:TatD DNase family protein
VIDSHCHLDDPRFDPDREAVLERARAAGLTLALAIDAVGLAESVPWLYATAGVHPHEAAGADRTALEAMERRAQHPKVLAVGEIGLDYHYEHSPRSVQRDVFAAQLAIARRAAKPVVIHTREAWADTVSILRAEWDGTGVMHCFSGTWEAAVAALDLGFYLSLAGILTFPKAASLRETAAKLPLDRLLIETDAPYLAPVPHRGKRNEPAYVVHTAQALAEARRTPLEEVVAQTTANFARLFQLRLPPPTGKLEP